MVDGIFRYLQDMEDFIEDLDGRFKINEKLVFYVIEDIKRENYLSDLRATKAAHK